MCIQHTNSVRCRLPLSFRDLNLHIPLHFAQRLVPRAPQNPSISYSTRPIGFVERLANKQSHREPSPRTLVSLEMHPRIGPPVPCSYQRTIPPSPSFIGTAFTSKRVTVQLDKAYILGDHPQIPQNRVMLACSTHGTFDSLAIQESRCRWTPKAP